MPVFEGGAGVPTPGGVDMVAAWVAPPDEPEVEEEDAAEPDAPAPKSRGKKGT